MRLFRSGSSSAALATAPSRGGSSARDTRTVASRPRGRKRLITGLDIGTTKVCAVIAEASSDGEITILGLGSAPSRGVRRGAVTDIALTVDAIGKALQSAYELARVMPQDLYIGIAGDHVSGINCEAMVEVAHPSVGIDDRDRRNVIDRAMRLTLPPDQEILYKIVREFSVNGNWGIHNPLGLFGSRLEVRMHVITASNAAVNNMLRCVKKAGRKTGGVVLQSIASSLSVLEAKDREMGVVVVDIGGGTTDVAIFADHTLQYTGEVARGGDMITHDVATILRCTPYDAENLKKKFGHANPLDIDADEIVELPGPPGTGRKFQARRRELAEIVEARVEDIFFDVKKVIQRSGQKDRVYAGVVLTGGTALLEGISGVAERILDFPARIGMPRGLRGLGEVVSSPIYSTGVGLVKWAAEEGPGFQRDGWLVRKIKEVIDIYV